MCVIAVSGTVVVIVSSMPYCVIMMIIRCYCYNILRSPRLLPIGTVT